MSSSSPFPNTRDRAHGLREKADRLSKSALKLEKNIKVLKKEEADAIIELVRQKGYFPADTDKAEKLENKIRKLEFDINNKEEEGETIHAQVRDTLSELDSIEEEEDMMREFSAELRKMSEGETDTRKRKRGA